MVLCFQLQMRRFFGLSNNPSLAFPFFPSFKFWYFRRRSETFLHGHGRRFPRQPITINNQFGWLHEEQLFGTGQTPCIDASTALIRAAIAEVNSGETPVDIPWCTVPSRCSRPTFFQKSPPPAPSFGPTERPGTSSCGCISAANRTDMPQGRLRQLFSGKRHPLLITQSSFSVVLMSCQRSTMDLSPNDRSS